MTRHPTRKKTHPARVRWRAARCASTRAASARAASARAARLRAVSARTAGRAVRAGTWGRPACAAASRGRGATSWTQCSASPWASSRAEYSRWARLMSRSRVSGTCGGRAGGWVCGRAGRQPASQAGRRASMRIREEGRRSIIMRSSTQQIFDATCASLESSMVREGVSNMRARARAEDRRPRPHPHPHRAPHRPR